MPGVTGSRWHIPGFALVVTTSVLLLAGSVAVHAWAARAQSEASARPSAVVLLEAGTDREMAEALAADVRAWPGVEAVEVRTGADNVAWLSERGEVDVDGLTAAQMPATLGLRFAEPSEGLDAVGDRLMALGAAGGVLGVEVSRPEVVASVGALGRIQLGAVLVGLLAVLGGVLLVGTVQAAGLASWREELRASRGFDGSAGAGTWPIYREALSVGAVGGSFAALVLAWAAQGAPAPGLLGAVGDGGAVIGLAFLAGVVLATLGTFVGVRRHLEPQGEVA